MIYSSHYSRKTKSKSINTKQRKERKVNGRNHLTEEQERDNIANDRIV